MKLKNKKLYFYTPYAIIFINFIFNKVHLSLNSTIAKINIFDLISTSLLFFLLLLIGKSVKKFLDLPYVTSGIIFYLLSFFVFDNFILFFYQGLTTSEIYVFVNFIWIIIFLINKQFKNFAASSIIYILLTIFNNVYYLNLSKNQNIIGDVKDIHFEHVKNIYEKSYFYSINNPTLEGYPQLVAYLQALLNKILFFDNNFIYLKSSTFLLLFLSILLFNEVSLKKSSKAIISILFISIIYNSEWLKILFVNSLMTEGMLSYLFCSILISLTKNIEEKSKRSYISFFLLGILYLSKQFISLIGIIIIFYFLLDTRFRKSAFFGLIGLTIKETSSYLHFSKITKNYHLKEVDFLDTIFDLLLYRNLKLENIVIIFRNLLVDRPFALLTLYFFILLILNFRKFGFQKNSFNLLPVTALLNYLFIFILYISIWRNMELESPIRYMLNFLHIILISQFKFIDNLFENKLTKSTK